MKITKRQLRKIIREERALFNESWRLDEPKVDDWSPQQYSESDDSEYNSEVRSVWLQNTGEKRHKEHVAAGDLDSVNAYVKMQIQSVDGTGLKPEELEQLKSLQAHKHTSSTDIPFIMPAIVDRLPDFHDPASQEKFRSMSGTAKPAAKATASSSPANRGKRHSYDARVLEPMDAGMNTNADAVDGVLADLQRVGANNLADEVDMMIQMGDDDIGGVLAMIPNSIKDKLSEGKQMKITKRQLRRIIREMNIPNPRYIDDPDELNLQIAMKIKDMMPPNEALGGGESRFKDLVVNVYETHFDPEGEGWEPWPKDLEAIEDHLTIVPLPDDDDFYPEEHGRYYDEHPTYDDAGQQDGANFTFRKNESKRIKITNRQLRKIIKEWAPTKKGDRPDSYVDKKCKYSDTEASRPGMRQVVAILWDEYDDEEIARSDPFEYSSNVSPKMARLAYNRACNDAVVKARKT